MDILKKTLLSILVFILAAFAIFFVIEGVDWILHASTYSKVDTFFKGPNNSVKAGHDKICLDKLKKIGLNTQNVVMRNPKAIVSQEYKEDKVYDDAISACKQSYAECEKVIVPKDIPEKTVALLQKVSDTQKQIMQYYIDQLTKLKNCKGENACLIKLSNSSNNETLKLINASLDYISAATEAKKRFSLASFREQYQTQKHIKQAEIMKKYFDK